MKRRPATFGELLSRIAPPSPPGAFACQPIIASAVELGADDRPLGRPLWVVVHGVTDADMRLIHARPIRAKKLSVHFTPSTGEILRITLEAMASRQQGELYETRAEFSQFGQEIHTASA
jgi:hypothetical protein